MAAPRTVRAGTRIRTIPFSGEGDAERYRRTRYRRGPQQLVDVRERAIVARALAELRASGALGEASRVLDVPCGFGRLLQVVRARQRHCFGADLSEAQARQARAAAPALAGNLLAGLPFPDGTFDLVLCVRLLHHLADARDRAGALAELARVSRGHVLVSDYGDARLWRWHRGLMQSLKRRRPRVAVVSRAVLLRDAADAGLAPVGEWTVLPAVHAHRFVLMRRT